MNHKSPTTSNLEPVKVMKIPKLWMQIEKKQTFLATLNGQKLQNAIFLLQVLPTRLEKITVHALIIGA